eukprot:15462-Heterococcus_DN1.PRE.2
MTVQIVSGVEPLIAVSHVPRYVVHASCNCKYRQFQSQLKCKPSAIVCSYASGTRRCDIAAAAAVDVYSNLLDGTSGYSPPSGWVPGAGLLLKTSMYTTMTLHASTLSPCNLQAQPSQDDTASTTEYPALGYSNDDSYYNGTAGLLYVTGDSYGGAAGGHYDKRKSFDTADTAEGVEYYHNSVTGTSQYERPAGFSTPAATPVRRITGGA